MATSPSRRRRYGYDPETGRARRGRPRGVKPVRPPDSAADRLRADYDRINEWAERLRAVPPSPSLPAEPAREWGPCLVINHDPGIEGRLVRYIVGPDRGEHFDPVILIEPRPIEPDPKPIESIADFVIEYRRQLQQDFYDALLYGRDDKGNPRRGPRRP